MQVRIKVSTFLHKQDMDELKEFEKLEKLGMIEESEYPKPEQILKLTTINAEHISFYQELEDGRTGIIMASGVVLMTPRTYNEVERLIEIAYEPDY